MIKSRELLALIVSISFFVLPYVKYPINLIFVLPIVLLFPGLLLTFSMDIGIVEKFALGSFISILANGVGLTILALFSLFYLSYVVLYVGLASAILYFIGVIYGKSERKDTEKLRLKVDRKDVKLICIFVPVIMISTSFVYLSTSNELYSSGYIEFYMEPLKKLKQNETYTVNVSVVNHYADKKHIVLFFYIIHNNVTLYNETVERTIQPSESFVKKFYFRARDKMLIVAELYVNGKFYDKLRQTVRTY